MTNTSLLKSIMVRNGDDDCVKRLADILNISRPTASLKLNNKTSFTQKEISDIVYHYKLDPNQIVAIFLDDERFIR